LTFEKIKVL